MRYRKGGTRQKNAHAARRNVCAIVRAVYVLCTFCFLPLVLLVLRNSLICSHACFTLTFCSFTFCFIPRMEMAHRLLQKRNFQLTSEADKELYTLIVEATAQRDEYFGNGRWLHNLIEQGIIKCMAQRIMSQPSIPDNTFLFRTITQEDVVKAGNRLRGKQVVKLEPQPIRRIGFRA